MLSWDEHENSFITIYQGLYVEQMKIANVKVCCTHGRTKEDQ